MKRIRSGSGMSGQKRFPSSEKPVRLKERWKSGKPKKRIRRTGEEKEVVCPYMVANEATDAPGDKG